MTRIFFVILISWFCIIACKEDQKAGVPTRYISKVFTSMTEAMVNDVTNPPLAARFFSYAAIAGHLIVEKHDSTILPIQGRLNGLEPLNWPEVERSYDYQVAAVLAMTRVAQKLQPSGSKLVDFEKAITDSLIKSGISEDVLDESARYADAIVKQVLAYAKSDGYNRISNYARYVPLEEEGKWYPTPPAFFAAVEPHFNRVRPFLLDSASQFSPKVPVEFSTDTTSAFFQMMLLNYRDTITETKKEIAGFWDCNPFVVQDKGHLMLGVKRISPGAHWMGISGLACDQAGKSFNEAIHIQTMVAIGLMDAFISCWDEKFRSNRVRPETAIRKYIDTKWKPMLQTPPFPEYVSGHSVVSTTSSEILEHYFGDGFAFTDTVEVSYGLKARSFKSFDQAAEEAAISRFYGGIHFMDAIVEGQAQGRFVGQFILQRLKEPAVKKKAEDPIKKVAAH